MSNDSQSTIKMNIGHSSKGVPSKLFVLCILAIAIVLTCAFVFSPSAGCSSEQEGNWFVVRREMRLLGSDGRGRLDCLFGNPKEDSSATPKSLLVFLIWSASVSRQSSTENSGDGPFVSVTNVQLVGDGAHSFGYGSAWNRVSDNVAIQNQEFSRAKGNVFVILEEAEGQTAITQIELTVDETTIDDVVAKIETSMEEAIAGSKFKSMKELVDTLRQKQE